MITPRGAWVLAYFAVGVLFGLLYLLGRVNDWLGIPNQ